MAARNKSRSRFPATFPRFVRYVNTCDRFRSVRGIDPNTSPSREARDAVDWLLELLCRGPMQVKTIRNHGEAAGFAWRTLQRAMRLARIASRRGGFGLPATWALPESAPVAPVAPLMPVAPTHFDGATVESGATEDIEREGFTL